MAREQTAAMETATLDAEVRPALFYEGQFDSGTVYLWSGYGSISWNGQTWLGAGQLLEHGGFEETVEIRATGTSVTLTGIPSEMLSLALQEDYQGRDALIYLGAFTSAGALIADPTTLYRGRMDVMEIDEGGETASITVSIESRLIDLERPRERRYTDQDQKIDYPDDRGLEFIAAIQDKEIIWGKK